MFGGGDTGGSEVGHDEGISVGRDSGSLSKPAHEVGFEAVHVGCTCEARFTGHFVSGLILGKEDAESGVEEVV